MNTEVDACVPVDVEQFHRVLAIELGTSIEYAPTAAQQPDGTAVHVVCVDEAAVQLQLEDNLTRKSMQRIVELPSAEIGTRTRLLALSVAELVVASWVELQLARPPLTAASASDEALQAASELARARLPASQGTSGNEEPDGAASVAPRWLLGVSFEPMLFSGERSGLLPQLSLQLEQRVRSHFVLGLTVSIGRALWEVYWPVLAAGDAQVSATSGRLTVGYVTALDWFELSLAAGARGGVVYMSGNAERTGRTDLLANELFAPWGGPLVLLTAAALIGPIRVALQIEAGYVTLPAEAVIRPLQPCMTACTPTVVAELRGVWGSAGLGLGWLF